MLAHGMASAFAGQSHQERNMSLQAYITIKKNNISQGASSQNSLGQVASSDSSHNDQITVVSFLSNCLIPRDPNSAVATGTRIYQPVTFTKYFDASSPLLWNALANNLGVD